jgi:glycosyltransferase involved in cell wall biosynthesis
MSARRAVIVTHYFPPESGAGARRARALARFLGAGGYDTTVFTGMPNYPERRVQASYRRAPYRNAREDGVRVVRMRAPGIRFAGLVPRSLHELTLALLLLARLVLSPRSDLLLVTMPSPYLALAGRAARALRKTRALVFDVRDLTFLYAAEQSEGFMGRLGMRMHRAFCRVLARADAVTTTSEGIRDRLVADGVPPALVTVVPNGVDELPPPRDGGRGGAEPLRVVYAGLIGRAQGVEQLARVAERMNGRAVVFDVYGAGPCADELRAQIEARGVAAKFNIAGMVPLDEVASALARADVAVVTLRDEIGAGALPTKILDAMASALPVLFLGSGEGAALVERAGSGIAKGWADDAAAARALESLLDDGEMRAAYGRRGRAYVEANLTREAILSRTLLPVLEAFATRDAAPIRIAR